MARGRLMCTYSLISELAERVSRNYYTDLLGRNDSLDF